MAPHPMLRAAARRPLNVAISFALLATLPAPGAIADSISPAETALFPSYRDLYHVAADPLSFAGGDLNADGRMDVVTSASIWGHTLSLVISNPNGDGALTSAMLLPDNPYDVEIADLTGDGRLDIIAAIPDDFAFALIPGAGNGQFGEPIIISASPIQPTDVVIGDVDNDGDADIIAATFISDAVVVFLNDGEGGFDATPAISMGDNGSLTGSAWPMDLVDINGDARPDLIMTTCYLDDCHVRLLHNQGGGAFELVSPLPYADGVVASTLADLDEDGHIDIVVTNVPDREVVVRYGTGDGFFFPYQRIADLVYPSEPNAVTTADVNGDGRLDVIFANRGRDTISIVFGEGDRAFSDPVAIPAGVYPRGVISGRFDDDDHLDLAIVNLRDDSVSVLHNQGDGSFPSPPALEPDFAPSGAAFGHLNDDAHLDLVVGVERGGFAVLLGEPGGSFQPPVDYPAFGDAKQIFLAPLDNDDDLDVVVVNELGAVFVAFNNGDGSLETPDTYPSNPRGRANGFDCDACVIDITGDGALDIFTLTSDSDGSYLRTYRNDGAGGFHHDIVTVINHPAPAIALGDVNGDSRIDACVALPAENGVRIMTGLGNGTFNTTFTVPLSMDPYGLKLADLDEDGPLDLIVSYEEDVISVLRGTSSGGFRLPVDHRVTNGARELRIADVNGDGRLDIITGEAVIDVLLNEGGGEFAPVRTYAHGGVSDGTAIGDVDLDGDPDIARAIPGAGRVYIIPNLRCPPDLTGDRMVNGDDLFALLGAWGSCATERSDEASAGDDAPCPADINRDAVVDDADLFMLLANWGACETGA